jgi:ferredoxin
MTKESLAAGKPGITCNRCGACIDICPEQALGYKTLGVPLVLGAVENGARGGWFRGGLRKLGRDLWDPAVVFVFGVFMLGNVLASGYFVDAASRLLKHFAGI